MAVARTSKIGQLSNSIPTPALKKVNGAFVKPTVNFNDDLTVALMTVFEPLITALDDKPELLKEASSDFGHTNPSAQDSGMKYLLNTMLAYLHRQNFGPIIVQKKDKHGNPTGETMTYDSNKERMEKSQQRLADITDINDADAFKTMYWAKVNEERFKTYEALRHSLAMVYREIFNENWEALPQEQAGVKKIDPASIDEATKKKWAQFLAEKKQSQAA